MEIANHTTKVDESAKIGEIQGILAKHGARSGTVDYTDGKPLAD